jgi:hypothetical protein
MNPYDEYFEDSYGLEIGSVHTHHNGLSVVWAFEVAGGPVSQLAYQTKQAAYHSMLRVTFGKSELISIKRAKPVAATWLTKGMAHVVRGKVLGIFTNVRVEITDGGDLIYVRYDHSENEVVFDGEDQLDVVE